MNTREIWKYVHILKHTRWISGDEKYSISSRTLEEKISDLDNMTVETEMKHGEKTKTKNRTTGMWDSIK